MQDEVIPLQPRCHQPQHRRIGVRARRSPWPAAAYAVSSKPFHSAGVQAGAAPGAPTRHACRWSSDTRPRTRPSRVSSCCEEWCQPSERPDADMPRTAIADVQPTDKPVCVHTGDMRTRRASGRPPGIFDMPLHWRTPSETGASFSGMKDVASPNPTAGGLLKQPDKHKFPSGYLPFHRLLRGVHGIGAGFDRDRIAPAWRLGCFPQL
jgi:hypothetical protein